MITPGFNLQQVAQSAVEILTHLQNSPEMSSPITTHILDTSRGMAAANVAITLSRLDAATGEWRPLRSGQTNADGRCATLITAAEYEAGHSLATATSTYRLRFEVGDYFAQQAVATIYPFVEVVFEANANQKHYHIPLLLNPFGYSTYRGT